MAMLFCQLGRAHSLREICGALACCEGQLKHLGVPVAPKKSTLAYANEHRPWELYQTVFEQTLFKCRELVASQGGRKKFCFKNKLMSLDGSIIDLSVSMFDWAKYRRTKGAIKLHLLLDHDGYLPSFAVVTEGKKSEIKVARTLRCPDTIANCVMVPFRRNRLSSPQRPASWVVTLSRADPLLLQLRWDHPVANYYRREFRWSSDSAPPNRG
jgi:hypothetical protein